ncbi:glutamate ligase domain-containing protein, partial [Thermodesulfobacteriota bacterium]
LGAHQRVNAASAIGLTEMFLGQVGRRLDPRLVRSVLGELELPGRTNLVDGAPKVLLDGAHNVMAVRVLMETIERSLSYDRLITIFACSRDKDIAGILGIMEPVVDEWVLSGIDFPRTADPAEVAEILKGVTDAEPVVCALPDEAWERAIGLAGPDDLICCCGSFYLAGEVQKLMAQES